MGVKISAFSQVLRPHKSEFFTGDNEIISKPEMSEIATFLFLIETGFDYTQHMFWLRNKEYKFQLLTLN